MWHRNWTLRAALVVVGAAALAGCQLGPVAMRASRTMYNKAVQDTASEQLLLNIVRLRYREPMCFLELNSVSTAYTLTVSGGLTTISPLHAIGDAVGTSAGTRERSLSADYSEAPTLVYGPLQGAEFAKRVLSGIDPKVVAYLLHSGWHADKLMRLIAERIGDRVNDPREKTYQRFLEKVEEWRKYQEDGELVVTDRPGDELKAPPLMTGLASGDLAVAITAAKEGYEFRKNGATFDMFRVVPVVYIGVKGGGKGQEFRIQADAQRGDSQTIQVRSFVNVLFQLAQDVPVPSSHARRVEKDAPTAPESRDRKPSDLLEVHYSIKPPRDAVVSVRHHGVWFYIKETDCDSKDTFALLSQIFAIQAGEIKSTGPLLTLPVSR